eukprot:TRINITY_DN12518_c0_g1_i1.p1 TRINITY_DN12518_c0_g1~~TRINITY_DN12518_c0_g1_i1.p1  ORF type:complete len:133 (-),score=16.61 TRINITY_DN12518_c0_g1_i1:940-1338(-)
MNHIVKRSSIRGAGRGVFSLVSLRAGVIIGKYAGKIISQQEHDRRDSGYVLAVTRRSKQILLDACDPRFSNWTAFINDYRTPDDIYDGPNVRFTPSGCVETLREIDRGEELLVDYGNTYWTAEHDGTKINPV